MKRYLLATALALAGTVAAAQTQGVGKAEITLGTIQGLCGPIASHGKQMRMGMLLRVEEANEQGGVHGRRLALRSEDSAYDPKRAVLAAQKLVHQDRIFAMVGHLGSANNLAAMPLQFERTASLMRAIDGMVVPPDLFGGPQLSWSASKRLGSDASRLSQIVDGRWKVVSGYLGAL